MNILIAIPCYGGLIHANFTQSLLNLAKLLSENQILHKIEFLGSESLISRARNSFIAKFYGNADYSHILFLDCDLLFNPIAVIKMLKEDKELIGCPYPKKVYNWQKVKNVIDNGSLDEQKVLMTDINYNFLESSSEIEINNTCVKVKDVPTGFMLIKRSVITALILAYPERQYKNNIAGIGEDNSKDFFYDFFSTGVVDGYYLSEDYYFCHLVRQLGIDCWLEVGFTFGHIGREIFYGNLGLQLQKFGNDNYNMDKIHLANI